LNDFFQFDFGVGNFGDEAEILTQIIAFFHAIKRFFRTY
jgi:hypothetical protein